MPTKAPFTTTVSKGPALQPSGIKSEVASRRSPEPGTSSVIRPGV
jgi:hypothetical protein